MASTPPVPRPDRRRWPVLAVMCVIVIVVYTDTLMAAIALPSLARDLDASTSALQWIVNSYTLVLAGLLIPGGAIADRIGRRRALLGGLVVFGIASVGAAWQRRQQC
jgi:MFS family permease